VAPARAQADTKRWKGDFHQTVSGLVEGGPYASRGGRIPLATIVPPICWKMWDPHRCQNGDPPVQSPNYLQPAAVRKAALILAIAVMTTGVAATAVAEGAPNAGCTTTAVNLDLRIGQGIPLPPQFSNPTSSTVTFTMHMKASYFFGPARDVGTVTLPPKTGRSLATVVPTRLHTPMGSAPVIIEVRTNKTGGLVVGKCDYRLRLSAPRGVTVWTGPRLSTRWQPEPGGTRCRCWPAPRRQAPYRLGPCCRVFFQPR
jgi:hypothetical protein